MGWWIKQWIRIYRACAKTCSGKVGHFNEISNRKLALVVLNMWKSSVSRVYNCPQKDNSVYGDQTETDFSRTEQMFGCNIGHSVSCNFALLEHSRTQVSPSFTTHLHKLQSWCEKKINSFFLIRVFLWTLCPMLHPSMEIEKSLYKIKEQNDSSFKPQQLCSIVFLQLPSCKKKILVMI